MSTRRRWHGERVHDPTARQKAFHRPLPERRAFVVDALFGLVGSIITATAHE